MQFIFYNKDSIVRVYISNLYSQPCNAPFPNNKHTHRFNLPIQGIIKVNTENASITMIAGFRLKPCQRITACKITESKIF